MKSYLLNKFKQGDIAMSAINLTVAVIIVLGAGIPITQSAINTANLTGITAVIVSFIPVFMALALLIGAVAVMRGGN